MEGDNERLPAMKFYLWLKRFAPPAGLKPGPTTTKISSPVFKLLDYLSSYVSKGNNNCMFMQGISLYNLHIMDGRALDKRGY